MATLDSSVYRRETVPPMTSHRRATVGSPLPFPFSNTFESHRPSSRTDRLNSDFPYRHRRSTLPGHEGHSVNDAPPLAPHDNVMWSDSASPSPIISGTDFLPGASPTPSSSCGSPKPTHPSFDYNNPSYSIALHSPIQPSFSLCSSSEYSSNLSALPRSMPAPVLPILSSGTSSMRSLASTSAPTPSLSSTSSTSFTLDPALDPSSLSYSSLPSDLTLASMSREMLEAEVSRYRSRVRELEFYISIYNHRLRIAEQEGADNKSRIQNELGLLAQDASSLPPADSSRQWTAPHDWEARTAARIKRYCALNRAGNALCAWHDSRRERREYSPRMAPPNTLNCGCTFAEALFEESLARNNVGAYYPGENVRMDPALRNPLLRLLEKRYGYRDGDFERLPNGEWREGEDAHNWEQRITSSRPSSKRDR